MSVETKSRKRVRSVSSECIFTNQNKYFINQQIIDQNDANKMKEIHGEFDNNQDRCISKGTLFGQIYVIFHPIPRQNH